MTTRQDGSPSTRGAPIVIEAHSAEDTRAVGATLAGLLRAGDVVILSGDLGAGKTTFAQGMGASLGIRGEVTSPTFVISRVHPSLVGGPALVHVDAYRIHGAAELDDLDLDETLADAITVVEWGDGLADALAEDRMRVHLTRRRGLVLDSEGTATDGSRLDDDEPRTISIETTGPRWDAVQLRKVLGGSPDSCS